MNVETIAAKLKRLAAEIEVDKGPLSFLSLCLREDALGLWDLVIAAPWLNPSDRSSYQYVANKLQGALSDREVFSLSSVVVLGYGSAAFKSFLSRFKDQTGLSDVYFITEGGAVVRQVYMILARQSSDQLSKSNVEKSATGSELSDVVMVVGRPSQQVPVDSAHGSWTGFAVEKKVGIEPILRSSESTFTQATTEKSSGEILIFPASQRGKPSARSSHSTASE
jgi:hypothetical protein